MRNFDVVVAADSRLGIGKNGTLPWRLPKDMAYFKELTSIFHDPLKRNAVIMGRKTYQSIPPRFRPLDNRLNIVLTRQLQVELPEEVVVSGSLDGALGVCSEIEIETVFVIGGGEVFAEALRQPQCLLLFLTKIHYDFVCDTFLPDYTQDFISCDEQPPMRHCENGIEYEFAKFIHKNKRKAGQDNCVGAAS